MKLFEYVKPFISTASAEPFKVSLPVSLVEEIGVEWIEKIIDQESVLQKDLFTFLNYHWESGGQMTKDTMKISSAEELRDDISNRRKTLRLSSCWRYQQDLGDLYSKMLKLTRAEVRMNAYYSHAMAQGARLHHDVLGTFVVQLWGEKNWLLLEEGAGDDVRHVTHRLVPGDLLFVPAAIIHKTWPANASSLHVSLSIAPAQGTTGNFFVP